MRCLFGLLMVLSCAHEPTDREFAPVQSGQGTLLRSVVLYTSACPKAEACSEMASSEIATYICKEKHFHDAHAFKIQDIPENALPDFAKLHVCDLKRDTLGKSRCEWAKQMYADSHLLKQVFEKITCRKIGAHGEDIFEDFKF